MQAAYAHLVLTHVPLIGTLGAIVLLAVGLVFRNNAVARAGFLGLILAALVAIPTYLTGESAEEMVERVPGVFEPRVEHHADVAIFGLVTSLALGGIALVSLIAFRRRPVPRAYLFILTLLSFIPFGALAWTANTGGKVRHTEVFPLTRGDSAAAESHEGGGERH